MQTNCETCKHLFQKINQHEQVIAQLVQMTARVNQDMKKITEIQSFINEKHQQKYTVTTH